MWVLLLLVLEARQGHSTDASGTPTILSADRQPRQPTLLQSAPSAEGEPSHVRALSDSLTDQRACIYSAFPGVVQSCSATAGGRAGAGPRDELIKLLQRCTGASTRGAPQVVRLSIPISSFGLRIQAITRTYARLLSVSIRVDQYSINQLELAARRAILYAADFNRTQEAWLMLAQHHLGDALHAGSLRRLTNVVALDQRLNWLGFLPVLREAALLYKSEVVSLPFSSYTRHFMYRKDMFAKYNITVPRTWRELLSFAKTYNGTEGMHAVCLHWGSCYGGLIGGIWEVMSSYFQTHGYKKTAFLDSDTMELLVDNEGMAEVLEVFKALVAISPTDDSEARLCPLYPYRFVAGQCMTTQFLSFGYKQMSHRSQAITAAVRGKVGYSIVPGSDRVYNRQIKNLVPCDPVTCPYATRYSKPDGSSYLVNHVPWLGMVVFTLNAHSPPALAFSTLAIVSYLLSEQIANTILYDPLAEYAPTRTSQLNPTTWIAAGYNEHDTYEFMRSFTESINHPNVLIDLRLRGNQDLSAVWYDLFTRLGNMTSADWMRLATQRFNESLMRTFNGNMTAMKMDYWASLNREWPRAQPPPQPTPSNVMPGDGMKRDTSSQAEFSTVIPSVVVPVFAAVVAVLMVARYRGLLGLSRGARGHPGPGPLTTLCVSDIEDSTLLWEALDAQLMDASVKLHNACIRKLAAQHGGYESVWEGDSFIIAFHRPAAALHFCMDVQQELLSLPWPTELLQSGNTAEVWCKPVMTVVKGHASPSKQKPGSPSKACAVMPAKESTQEGSSPYVIPAQHGSQEESLCAGEAHSTMRGFWQQQWQHCSADTSGAVLAYRGLRVRLGIHAGVADAAAITFNSVMQRYHYTGPIRVISNAVASAGHGGYTLMSTDTAALLDSDKTGVLTDLPEQCSVYYWGRHILSGVGEQQQLLLVLPNSLTCRLALQECEPRVEASKTAGIWACPVPSPAAAAATALAYVQFTGLSTLMAWDAAETSKAMQVALTCIHDTMLACQGTLSEDGLSSLLDPAASKSARRSSFPDSTARGRMACVFSAAVDTSSPQHHHPAVAFALAVRDRLLTEDWSDRLLSHELTEQLGTPPSTCPDRLIHCEHTQAAGLTNTAAQESWPPSGQLSQSNLRRVKTSLSGTEGSALLSQSGTASRQRSSALASPVKASLTSHPRPWSLSGLGAGAPPVGPQSAMQTSPGQPKTSISGLFGSLHSRLLSASGSKAQTPSALRQGSATSPRAGVKQGRSSHVVIESASLRGPRFKMVVVDAQGATHTVATRSSGLVVFSGAPEKRAGKLIGHASA